MPSALPVLSNQSFSLRVAVIENCQFSCPYCLPGSVKPITRKPAWLSKDQYLILGDALSHLPITKIRFTGGEPLLRRDLCDVIWAFKTRFPEATLSLTTNGQHLEKNFLALLKTGLSRLNVHIDSLSQEKYQKVMGKGNVSELLTFLQTAKLLINELKINVVLQHGVNDDELSQFIDYSMKSGIEVRFIELMNTGSAKNYTSKAFLAGADAVKILRKNFNIKNIGRRHKSDPADIYEVVGSNTQFGLIASDTEPFCEDCNRLRLNTHGDLRGCLYQPKGLGLGNMLRLGLPLKDMRDAIDAAVSGKRSFHPLINRSGHDFSMAEIGG